MLDVAAALFTLAPTRLAMPNTIIHFGQSGAVLRGDSLRQENVVRSQMVQQFDVIAPAYFLTIKSTI